MLIIKTNILLKTEQIKSVFLAVPFLIFWIYIFSKLHYDKGFRLIKVEKYVYAVKGFRQRVHRHLWNPNQFLLFLAMPEIRALLLLQNRLLLPECG